MWLTEALTWSDIANRRLSVQLSDYTGDNVLNTSLIYPLESHWSDGFASLPFSKHQKLVLVAKIKIHPLSYEFIPTLSMEPKIPWVLGQDTGRLMSVSEHFHTDIIGCIKILYWHYSQYFTLNLVPEAAPHWESAIGRVRHLWGSDGIILLIIFSMTVW